METPMQEIIKEIKKEDGVLTKGYILSILEGALKKEKAVIIEAIVDFQKQKRLKSKFLGLGEIWNEVDEKYFQEQAEQYYKEVNCNQ